MSAPELLFLLLVVSQPRCSVLFLGASVLICFERNALAVQYIQIDLSGDSVAVVLVDLTHVSFYLTACSPGLDLSSLALDPSLAISLSWSPTCTSSDTMVWCSLLWPWYGSSLYCDLSDTEAALSYDILMLCTVPVSSRLHAHLCIASGSYLHPDCVQEVLSTLYYLLDGPFLMSSHILLITLLHRLCIPSHVYLSMKLSYIVSNTPCCLTCAFTACNILWAFFFFISLKSIASIIMLSTRSISLMICLNSLLLASLTCKELAWIASTIGNSLFNSSSATLLLLVGFYMFMLVSSFHVGTLCSSTLVCMLTLPRVIHSFWTSSWFLSWQILRLSAPALICARWAV